MKYLVNIREILEKEIEIEADSMMQAEEEAERQYREEKIVLNEMDYKGTEISAQQMRKIQQEEREKEEKEQKEQKNQRENIRTCNR